MKKLFTLTFILFSFFAKADYWTQKANITGGPRYAAVGFSIGNKGYIGTGNNNTTYYQDLWEYDPATNSWTQKATLPGGARYFATGFSVGGKGYIGLGQSTAGYLGDIWQFDPLTNSWTQIATFPGGARGFSPTAFSIGGHGYVGLGFDGADKKDLWQYDTLANTWIQKNDFAGMAMEQAAVFTIGNKAYVGTGETSVPMNANNNLWEYDALNDSWTQLANFPGTPRFSAAAFAICQWGYMGTGYDSAYVQHTDWYLYNVLTNTWIQKANCGSTVRSHDVSFSIGQKGYVGTGLGISSKLDDLWEYTPDSTCTTGMEELQVSNFDFQISPNPAKDFIVISYPLQVKEKITVTITDVEGKKVYETKLEAKTFNCQLSIVNYPKGIYFITLDNGKQKAVKKFVKQ